MIHEKLKEMGFEPDEIRLGDFDQIGEISAKKARSPDSELYRTAGCFFRPNYERGVLIYHLIKRFEIKSYFEIGWGRGYSALCAAKAMCDMGIDDGQVYTIDPALDDEMIKRLAMMLPKEWFDRINTLKARSQDVLPSLTDKYELVYIDGDHTFEGVKFDWEHMKDRYTKFLLFDDYHLPTNAGSDVIQCAKVIDEIDDPSKELIIMDRRMFTDDRGFKDEEIDYGQVLLTHPDLDVASYLGEW